MYKVERKPAEPKSLKYEVMLSPFKTHDEATAYIKKYKVYYPTTERNYIITKI
jgi:hypothetical protein